MRLLLQKRLDIEEKLLQKAFGDSFRVQDRDRATARGVVGWLRSNAANRYVLWLELQGFPDGPPSVFVVDPPLVTCTGRPLPELSHRWHTRERNEHGHTQICHYIDKVWRREITLYKVVLKVRLWLEAYEAHLRTGKPISDYLSQMEARAI